jgi:hypothetical protein
MNKEELISKEFTLDLGSTPVKVVVKNITKDKVIVEYLNSTPGRMEEFTISDFEYFAMIKIDNNKDLIEDAYVNYCKHFVGYSDIPKIDWFIHEIKNNTEFSERWGLKIEERELNHDERFEIYKKVSGRDLQPHISGINFKQFYFDDSNVPTKQITITYNNKTIESYEN